MPPSRGAVRAADRDPLVHQRGVGDPPAGPDVAQPVGVGDAGVGDEHLVELGLAGQLAQRADLDPGRVHVEHEVAQPGVLGRVGVGAGEQQRPAGVVRERGPHLLPGDHPVVAVADGAGGQVGQVAARAGLAEELAPDVFGQPERLEPAVHLLVGAEGDDRGRGHAEPDHVPPRIGRGRPGPRELILGRLLERPGKAEAAVPYRVVHGGQAGVEPGAEELIARRARGIVVGAERAYRRAQLRFFRR